MSKACSIKGNQKVFLLHLNKVASCCRADPIDITSQSVDYYLDQWQQERQQLAQGIELPGCRHCWAAEHSGQQSYRQRFFNYNLNYVEIFLDNLCNQMCSYCSPKFSSEWANSIQKHGNFIKVSKSAADNLSIVPLHSLSNTKHWINELTDFLNREPVTIKLLGGEPLMQKRSLQQLLKFNTDNIVKLIINTNLNPPNNKFLKWVLDTFPKEKLVFEISLDTAPEHNAIPRAGFDAEKFKENLKLLKQYDVSFSFITVVSILNIFSIPQYQTWLEQQGHRALFFRLNNPDCLDPCYLPEEFKNQIWNESLPETVKQALDSRPTAFDLKLFEQYNYLNQYFQRTGIKITDSNLNRYLEWLREHYENSNSIRSAS